MFDELYPEATETALTAKLNRPTEPQPTQRFTVSGLLSAAPKGLAAGAAQALGSTADMLGAYGNVMGTTGGSAGGMFAAPSPEERKQQQEATDKLFASGPDYMSEGGRSFRNVAKDYTPDPLTTHAAEGAVFNLFRMGGKAITAAATMGNIPGAVIAGAEEGFTMADELAQSGVDLTTRTQVGAVNAVMNAGAFALPAAGKTWMQTGALALVGGPVSFVAQQAATREILQSADYSKQAEQYDPFDPVGLALSTILPLGFGALAMRGAKVRAKAGEVAPDAPSAIHPPDDIVDAARVSLVRQHMDGTNPVPGDLAAADAHIKAYSQAMDQMAAGQRVSVDVPDAVALRASEEMAIRIEPLRQELAPPIDLFHGTKESTLTLETLDKTSDIGVHFTTQRATAELFANDGGTPGSVIAGRGKFDKPLDLPDLNSWFPTDMARAIDEASGIRAGKDGQSPLEASVWNAMEAEKNKFLDAQPPEYQALRNEFGKLSDELATLKRSTGAAATEVGRQAGYEVLRNALKAQGVDAIRYKNMNEGAPVDTYIALDKSKISSAKTESNQSPPVMDAAPEVAESAATTPTSQPASPLETRLAAIESRNPAAMDAEIATAFDADGKLTERMTVRDYLDQVKREALADTQDAGLLEVAANCFLSGGL